MPVVETYNGYDVYDEAGNLLYVSVPNSDDAYLLLWEAEKEAE